MNDTWNLPAPPGFRGLRDDLPLTVYTRSLPHWRQPGATYFITFRLGDSLPAARLRELHALLVDWRARNPDPTRAQSEAIARETRVRVERWLDLGHGDCPLRIPECAREVSESLQHFDGERYELGCFVVMPNHVHVVVRPLGQHELEDVLKSWKQFTATKVNRRLGRSGSLWQEESFDRIVRDEEHLWRTIRYVGRNPRLGGLGDHEVELWIRPEWVELGWRFEDVRSAGGGSHGLEIRATDDVSEEGTP